MGLSPDFHAAIINITKYLPPAQRWIVAFEPKYHSRLVADLATCLGGTCELLRLGQDTPERVQHVAAEYRDDPRYAFLEFQVCDGELTRGGINYHDALALFWNWTEDRLRLFFDVTDNNVGVLFSESPRLIERRCLRMREKLSTCRTLTFRSQAGSNISIDCSAVEWHAYTGFAPLEYTLPSGEVACAPVSVDGELYVEGWIVGTIPFGIKYGPIFQDALRFSFRAGSIVRVDGEFPALCRDVEHVLDRIPALREVVEVGFGQSRAVSQAAKDCEVGCDWHERHFGLHLGLGATLPVNTISRRKTDHQDIVLRRGRVVNEYGSMVMRW